MTKRDKEIKGLIQLLVKHTISFIYASKVVHLLRCPIEMVELCSFKWLRRTSETRLRGAFVNSVV